jgi:N-acetylmuramoyl-L-alanine amidase
MYRVCVDPGHGGSDPGAIGPSGVRECDINLAVALKLKQKLIFEYPVILTRETDVDVSYPDSSASEELGARVSISDNFNADIFISIHCNAFNEQSHGIETWYCAGSTNGARLAQLIQDELLNTLNLADRGLKNTNEKSLYVLKYTNAVAVLPELAFISNPNEEVILNNNEWQDKIADALYSAIKKY